MSPPVLDSGEWRTIVSASNPCEEFDDIEFGGSGSYRIIVQGALDSEWSDRLAGLAISTVTRGEATPHTHLEGRIMDQAELRGVLESLYDLHLPILSVTQTRVARPEELTVERDVEES
jgi:hypothetical protein